jgi:hypothetical protein
MAAHASHFFQGKSDKKSYKWRGDDIVQPAFYVQRPTDPHRYARVVKDRQSQGSICGRQDGPKQEGKTDSFSGEQGEGRQAPSRMINGIPINSNRPGKLASSFTWLKSSVAASSL